MKYYDEKNKRLIIFQEKANSEFWDKHWQSDNFVEKVKLGAKNRFIKKITKKVFNPRFKNIGRWLWDGAKCIWIKSMGI